MKASPQIITRDFLLTPDFEVYCDNITLAQGCEGGISIEGPGRVWRDSDGSICYELHINLDAASRLSSCLKGLSFLGYALLQPDRFFDYSAVSLCGHRLNAKHTLPHSVVYSKSGAFVQGCLQKVDCAFGFENRLTSSGLTISESVRKSEAHEARTEEELTVEVIFQGELPFPCNDGSEFSHTVAGRLVNMRSQFNALVLEDGTYRFMMYHDTGKTVVQLVLPRRLYGPHTGNRIQEALQFALGKRLFVLAQDLPQSATCRFCLFSTKLVKGEGRGPLHFKGRVVTADFQQLFLKYFAFVNTDRDAFWHPLSAASLGVVEAEAASLESKMLALGVGIEGVVRHFDLPGVCEGVSNVFLDSVIKLIELVGAAGLDQEAVDAATVKLKDLKTINPKRKIAQFLKFKGRQEALAKTWSTMRGKFAHGGRIPPESILDAEICYSKCLSLLHVLVFSVIGYGGSFCDCTNGDQVLAQWD